MSTIDDLPLGFDTMVYCVPAGTKIEHKGWIYEVTESAVVHLENKWFCTQEIYDRIKAKTAKRLS